MSKRYAVLSLPQLVWKKGYVVVVVVGMQF